MAFATTAIPTEMSSTRSIRAGTNMHSLANAYLGNQVDPSDVFSIRSNVER